MSPSPCAAEATGSSPRLVRLSIFGAYAAAALVVAIGAAAFVGWAADVRWLRDPVVRFVPMMPNATLMFVLSGLALALCVRPTPRRRRAARVLAVLSAAMVLATMAQNVVGRDFGIDSLLFDVHPSRPAVPTAIALLLCDAAILVLDVRPRRGPAPAEILAAAAGAIGWLALGAFLYGEVQFYSQGHAAGMALNTSLALIALALGVVLARPGSGAMAVLTSAHVGGQAARRMLPIAFSIPVLGYAAVRLQGAALYGPPGAVVVAGVAAMVAALAIGLAVGASLDRTDAERRRLEHESLGWKRFFDSASFGAVLATPDMRFRFVNETFARMHGCGAAELEGQPISVVFPAGRDAQLADAVRTLRERGQCRFESEHLRKDGSAFPVVVDLSDVRDERGALLYRAAYVQDVTDEKKAQEARSRLASLVESSDDAIVCKALDGTVLDWNRGAERVYGYSAAEMIGVPITRIVPEDRRAERAALERKVLAGEAVVAFETERVRKDGRRIAIALTLSPIRDGVGRVVAFSTIERDITVLKQLEREREEWAAIVAHDLRQPASTIRLATEMLARTEPQPGRQKVVERIRRASDRLERMVGDLLDVSRIEAGRLSVRPEAVRLGLLVAEVVELTPEAADRCRAEIAPDAQQAWADGARVVQVLSNLVANALKYGDPGTPIDVRVERVGDRVQVTVTNEGPGIAPDEIPKLFSRFARTRSAESGSAPGLGLGLYICRGVIEAHGGELWVESEPGQKTHFRFTLPRPPASEARAAQPAAAALSLLASAHAARAGSV